MAPFRLLLIVPILGAAVLAGERSDPATTLIPAEADVCVRLPSMRRSDVLASEFKTLLDLLEGSGPLATLGKVPTAEWVVQRLRLGDEVKLDPDRPLYVALVGGDPVYILPAAAGTVIEGERALRPGIVASMRDGHVRVGKPHHLKAPVLGKPAAMLDGDVVVHVFLERIVSVHTAEIAVVLEKAAQMEGVEIKPGAKALFAEMLDVVGDVCEGVHSFDYALTLREGRLESEGILRTRKDSALKRYLLRAGTPGGAADLVGLLPQRSFIVGDGAGRPTWLIEDLRTMVVKHLGENADKALLPLMGPSGLCAEHTTGRTAFAVSMEGLMGGSSLTITELANAAKANEAIAAVDEKAVNEALENAGAPMTIQYELNASRHGETAIHRLAMRIDADGMMMISPMPMLSSVPTQSYFCVEGNYLLVADGATGERDLKALIDRVRAGERTDHPHLDAMARLGKKRAIGFTVNLGAVKPMAMMALMFEPRLGPVLEAAPDEIYLSTALDLENGNLHWRGDWPLAELTKIGKALVEFKTQKTLEEEGAPPPDEDFD